MRTRPGQDDTLQDPVSAYDAIAPYYRELSTTRKAYLRSIEQIVASNAEGRSAMLDIGAADGIRTLKIARAAQIPIVVAVEPSVALRARCPKEILVWGCSATDIPETAMRFDVITFLWNVLGHLQKPEERASALVSARRLLTPTGVILADFANRYNAAHYGWCATLRRGFFDHFVWSDTNGDAIVRWELPELSIATYGHVFTPRELRVLFKASGLIILNRWILSYRDGTLCRFPFSGHFLYRLAVL